MGLAASQCRLLTLTMQGNNIRYDLMKLSMDKMGLLSKSSQLSAEHSQLMNARKMVFVGDGGQQDLTYNELMTPCSAGGKQTILTNSSGAVVLAGKYLNLMPLLADSGAPGEFASKFSCPGDFMLMASGHSITDANLVWIKWVF